MKYGYFDDKNREYVITNPKTPVKWINYIGTLAFGGFVDHTGGALLCKGDPSDNRITKYIQQMPASDFKGTTLYIRIRQSGDYKIFSPFYVPTLDPFDKYECHVGLGYTRIVSEFYGVRTDVTIFVPTGAACEIRDITVTNISGQPMEIDVIPVVEYTHFDAVKQFTNADWVPQTMVSKAHSEPSGHLAIIQYPFMFRDIKVNYFTSNMPVSSFETDRKKFLGDNEYGTWVKPKALDQEKLSNTEATRGDNIAALLHALGTIKNGESKRIITQLGQETSLGEAHAGIARFRNPANVEQAFLELSAFWDNYLDKMTVTTPDASMNSMLNVHNPRQCYITKNWSRYLSYYQLGLGTRGLGFRDSSQDSMGVIDRVPDEARELIVKLLSMQKPIGSAAHQFNPITMEGSQGDARERPDRPQYYGDDHLWIVLAVMSYVKETGDTAFLEQEVPFCVGTKPGDLTGTVLEHLKRALDFSKVNTGANGLPLLGFADWNDCVNLPSGAESMFNTYLYGTDLQEMISYAQWSGDTAYAAQLSEDYETMKARVNDCAWDGEWYVRYFDHDGTPLGSHTNQQGRIYINGQTWAVLSGMATPQRGIQAMESVYKMLNTSKGIKVSVPGFNGFDPGKGGITTYPPGAKENGGIFLHTNPWAMIAETMLGNGDRAYEYYRQINPAAKNDIIDEYECEPYVYAQNILGDEHPLFGLARNSWLSGTAAWAYQAATKYILGIRPAWSGLRIDPCIPHLWDGFSSTRLFRGCHYSIVVKNPDHVCKGVVSIKVDGKEIGVNVIPVFTAGSRHEVEVVMGAGLSNTL